MAAHRAALLPGGWHRAGARSVTGRPAGAAASRYGFFGVWYSASFWNGFQSVS